MSHELRTPLNHIIGFTELVVDRHFGELNEIQLEYLNDVLQSSKHLLSLINDLLDIAKIEAGKMELMPTEVAFQQVMENSLVMIKEKAFKHDIQLSIDLNGCPETTMADERKLKQIMFNLLSNAVKFTPDGGKIHLSADLRRKNSEQPETLPEDYLEISVADSGIGIEKENLESIFDAFEQVDHSSNRKYPGTGLGLSLTRSLVGLHGGRIWAESEGKDTGSTFRFTLPIR
jgi:signal transduction histidine kinase